MQRFGWLALGVFVVAVLIAASVMARPSRPGSDMVDVILVLPDAGRPAPPSLPPGNRAARKAAAEGMRKAAGISQSELRQRLKDKFERREIARYRAFWLVNAVAVQGTPQAVQDLLDSVPGAVAVDNLPVRPLQAGGAIGGPPPDGWNVNRVIAPDVWNLGYRGAGTVVASMDSGVDSRHPDLAGAPYLGPGPGWCDVSVTDPGAAAPCTGSDIPNDLGALSGHGTAVMGVLVGGEVTGQPVGVAPGATWIAVRIFDDDGLSDMVRVLAGLEWLAGLPDPPDVINMSWEVGRADGGTPCDFPAYVPLQAALANLRALGSFLVAASGNQNIAQVPAAFPEVLAVGATNKLDYLWDYSGRGRTTCRTWPGPRPYPDVVAPGFEVVTTDFSNGGYLNYQAPPGTSIAAPHAAGVAALLLSAFPGIPLDELRTAMSYAAAPAKGGTQTVVDNVYGYGLVDALATMNRVLQTRVARPPRAWVTESAGGLDVGWDPVPDPGRPVSYAVLRDGVSIATGLASNRYTDAAGDAMAGHTYAVIAVDDAGEASAPSTAMLGNVSRDNLMTRDRVDGFDLIRIRAAFGTSSGDPGWDPACDLNGDGAVDAADRDIVAGLFGTREQAP